MTNSKTISNDQFLHIAKLSRLTINPDQQFIADQLSQAADYVEVLSQLPTDDVAPTYQVNHKKNVLRPDVVQPSFTQSQALSQAADTYQGYFKTKPTIKK